MLTIIKIKQDENGSHDNMTYFDSCPSVPDGWAVLPVEVGTPDTLENFPFGEVTAAEVDGVMTVTKWVPGVMPEPEPVPEPEPTQLDRVEAQATYTAMMTDTLLEG